MHICISATLPEADLWSEQHLEMIREQTQEHEALAGEGNRFALSRAEGCPSLFPYSFSLPPRNHHMWKEFRVAKF